MPILLWICLCCFLSLPIVQGQADPCYCLSFGVDFYEGAEDLSFVPVEVREQEGQLIQVYQEQNLGQLTAIAVMDLPPQKSSPALESLHWLTSPPNSISFHAAWKFDLKTAQEKMAAYAKSHHKELSELHTFNFLPPMDSKLHLQVFLVYNYKEKQWPIPTKDISMKANITVPAHPFYSDWNSLSPFKMKTPYLQVKLAHIPDYQWEVEVKDGVRIIQQLMPIY